MNKTEEGMLPAWTLLPGLTAQLVAVSLLFACQYHFMRWQVGAPIAVAIVVAASYFDRFTDRKYVRNQRRK